MRLVLDTNTVVSGLLWKSSPHQLLAIAGERRDISLHTSPKLLAELADVLSRNKLAAAVAATGKLPDALMRQYLNVVQIVTLASVVSVILADPDDDHVLACALARLPQKPTSSSRAIGICCNCNAIRIFPSSRLPRRYDCSRTFERKSAGRLPRHRLRLADAHGRSLARLAQEKLRYC